MTASCLHASRLRDNALALLDDLAPAALHALLECKVEDVMHALTGLGTTFDVARTDLLRDRCTLLWCDGRLALCAEHASCLFVLAQVGLGCDEDERYAFAEVRYLRVPLEGEAQWKGIQPVSARRRRLKTETMRTLSCTFASETGKSTEKTMRITSDSG